VESAADLNHLETARTSHANPIITSDESRVPQLTSKSAKASAPPGKLQAQARVETEISEVKEDPIE